MRLLFYVHVVFGRESFRGGRNKGNDIKILKMLQKKIHIMNTNAVSKANLRKLLPEMFYSQDED